MEINYLFIFISGALIANSLPHFIKGVFGQKHPTPFGRESSGIVNVIWAWINVVLALLLLNVSDNQLQTKVGVCFLLAGAVFMGLFAAWYSSKGEK